jgi:magnesium-transporting ATPase (P-type)
MRIGIVFMLIGIRILIGIRTMPNHRTDTNDSNDFMYSFLCIIITFLKKNSFIKFSCNFCRKRMSVIVRTPWGKNLLVTKGAESSVIPRYL